MELRTLIDHVRARALPARGAADPFAAAWAASTSLDDMIDVLRAGGAIGLYEVDAVTTWNDPPTRWLFRLKTPDGRYVRIDVERSQGADGLRAILPELAPYEQWAARLERERSELDPLEVLVQDLERDGRADRWLATHDLRTAWRTCGKSLAMRRLLELLGRSDLVERAQRAVSAVPMPPRASNAALLVPGAMAAASAAWDRTLADAIRTVIPAPPEVQ